MEVQISVALHSWSDTCPRRQDLATILHSAKKVQRQSHWSERSMREQTSTESIQHARVCCSFWNLLHVACRTTSCLPCIVHYCSHCMIQTSSRAFRVYFMLSFDPSICFWFELSGQLVAILCQLDQYMIAGAALALSACP